MKKLALLLAMLMIPALQLFAAEEYYHFETPTEQHNFDQLTTELRCLVCQNQNLAESNAPLANDLRKQIYDQIKQGQSKQKIIDYLVSRYGDFILYRPPLNAVTVGLWFGPLLLLIAGLSYLLFYLHKNKKRE
jgi:cytochrome c-type biogenesis protein CcmH